MFDLTSSKLLILGIVALIVVGPKDLPILLRTLGKYMGMVRRQAAEFRSQFDDAMREAELQQVRKDVETLGQEAQSALHEGEKAFQSEMASAQLGVDEAVSSTSESKAATPAIATTAGEPAHAEALAAPAPAPSSPIEVAAAAAAAAAEKSGA